MNYHTCPKCKSNTSSTSHCFLEEGSGELRCCLECGFEWLNVFTFSFQEDMDGNKLGDLPNEKELIKALTRCIEELMPGVGHVVCDVGHLNDTLIAAGKRLQQLGDN